MSCIFPHCTEKKTYGHHVTYRPRYIVRLCDPHHREITVCNINATEECRHSLSNGQRWAIYRAWLRGETRPVMTPRAEEWMKTWNVPLPIPLPELSIVEKLIARWHTLPWPRGKKALKSSSKDAPVSQPHPSEVEGSNPLVSSVRDTPNPSDT